MLTQDLRVSLLFSLFPSPPNQYVVTNIFRVYELNRVLGLLMSRTKARVPPLGSMVKLNKLQYIEYVLEKDERCYANMTHKSRGPPSAAYLATIARPETSGLDAAVNPDIHPGLMIKLVYFSVTRKQGFRYGYHNQMLRRDMIEAMGPLQGSSGAPPAPSNPDVKRAVVKAFAASSGQAKACGGVQHPLKVKIKWEGGAYNSCQIVPQGAVLGMAGPGPSSTRLNTRIDCICGENKERGEMIQCRCCGIWQHKRCILGPENEHKATTKVKLCFNCRILMADPFYQPCAEFQIPVHKSIARSAGHSSPQQAFRTKQPYYGARLMYRRGFHLSQKAFNALWQKPKKLYLAISCLLVEDKIQNRIHLPKDGEVNMNGKVVKVYNRISSKDLSDNGRDLLIDVSNYAQMGSNLITMTTKDTRSFVLCVQLMVDSTLEKVKSYVKTPALPREDLVKRVKGLFKIRGGVDVGFTTMMVSLVCPLSGNRIKTPVKASSCKHPKCFDLEAFLGMAKSTKKWQCPHCSKPLDISELEVDLYTKAILDRNGPSVDCIELNDEGKWRPYRKGEDGPWFDHEVTAPLADEESESEELDEEEEMRRAIAEAGIKKRPRPEPEVVSLLSSDEENEEPANPSFTPGGMVPIGMQGLVTVARQNQLQIPGLPLPGAAHVRGTPRPPRPTAPWQSDPWTLSWNTYGPRTGAAVPAQRGNRQPDATTTNTAFIEID